MPRVCTVCRHSDIKKINKEMRKANGSSNRTIAAQYGLTASAVTRHRQNCIKSPVQKVMEKVREKTGYDVFQEFEDQVTFAKEFRQAGQAWLNVDGQINFNPRADEVEVVYIDHSVPDKPVKRRDTLQKLLTMAQTPNRIPAVTIVRTADDRKMLAEGIRLVDMALDKLAKIAGLYQNDRANETDIQRVLHAMNMVKRQHPDIDQSDLVDMFATESGVDAATLRKHVQIQEYEETIG